MASNSVFFDLKFGQNRKFRENAASQGHQSKLFFSTRKKSKFFILQHKLSCRTQSQDRRPNIGNFHVFGLKLSMFGPVSWLSVRQESLCCKIKNFLFFLENFFGGDWWLWLAAFSRNLQFCPNSRSKNTEFDAVS